MSNIPKAVLYYFPYSIWCAAALLALEEKGYGDDEIDLKVVDLSKGENYDPTFLRLNPKATVPTLVVPLDKTLSEDVESRYKAITETKGIVEFLDQSRSARSRTHTTSSAPAPSLTPATIAATTSAKIIIEDILHSDDADPNALLYACARDDASLQALAKDLLPFIKGKDEAFARYISEAENNTIHVSDKVKNLWKDKKSAAEPLLEVLADADKPESALDEEAKAKRAAYFASARDLWEVKLKAVLTKLNKEAAGPYALGDQFSIADLHLAAWLARVVKLAGGNVGDDGDTAVGKLETCIGGGFSLVREFKAADGSHAVQNKLAAFWDAAKERASWKKVYGNGLY